jgi:hypothetical protein
MAHPGSPVQAIGWFSVSPRSPPRAKRRLWKAFPPGGSQRVRSRCEPLPVGKFTSDRNLRAEVNNSFLDCSSIRWPRTAIERLCIARFAAALHPCALVGAARLTHIQFSSSRVLDKNRVHRNRLRQSCPCGVELAWSSERGRATLMAPDLVSRIC